MCGVLLRTSDITCYRCGYERLGFRFFVSAYHGMGSVVVIALVYFALHFSAGVARRNQENQADESQRQEILQEQQQRRDLQNALERQKQKDPWSDFINRPSR